MAAPARGRRDLDQVIARLLGIGTAASMALVAVGVALMLVAGRSPLDVAGSLSLAALPGQVAALQPEGFLWLGLLAVLATPIARVVASAVAFAREGDRRMSGLAIAVLAVIAVGIAVGIIAES